MESPHSLDSITSAGVQEKVAGQAATNPVLFVGMNVPRSATSASVSSPKGPARLLSYLLPSLADILFISLLVALAYGTPKLNLLNDPGIGWHTRTGEWILQNHAIPHTDLFSNVTSRPWFAWEWLFDVGLAKVHSWWGLNGVVAAGAFTIALTFALLFRLTLRRGASLLSALAFVVLAALASTVHCLARPHLFTWFCTLLCWYLLEAKTEAKTEANTGANTKTAWIWAIPGIVLIWVNVHGGFLIAFALLGLTLAGELLQAARGSIAARPAAVQLGRVLGAAIVASLNNPYGINLYIHIYQYLSNTFLMHHIKEMQSPDFHSFTAQCFLILLFLSACVAITRRSLLRPGEVLILIFFSYSGLYAVRNIPVACIVLTLTVAPLLGRRQNESGTEPQNSLDGFSQRMGAMELNSRGHAWAIALVLATLLACSSGGTLLGQPVLRATFNPDKIPLRAVQFLTEHAPPGPLFTTDAWSGYVIYRAWPGLRVVVDDRHDMYGSQYMKQYLKIVNGEPDWNQQLHAMGAHSALVDSTSALGSLLRATPEWKLVYDDGQAALFESVLETDSRDSRAEVRDLQSAR